jgi:hypothetical protein
MCLAVQKDWSVLRACCHISGERAPASIEKRVGWAPESVWVLWRREDLLSLPEIQTLFLSHLVCSLAWSHASFVILAPKWKYFKIFWLADYYYYKIFTLHLHSQCVYFHFRALKNAQAKLRSQQNVNAQLEEQRRREEVRVLSCTAQLINNKTYTFLLRNSVIITL